MSPLLSTDVPRAAALLRAGGLVAFATETVYGLGANAFDPLAVARIFEAKGRPRFDPLIVHVASVAEILPLVTEFPALAQRLGAEFWPGPLTLVLPKRAVVPELVTSGLPHVAVRVPGLPQARELIRLAGCPVAAPSANLFGRVSPTTAAHVIEQLAGRIDLVLDGGACPVGIESTVLDLATFPPTLLRPGGVPVEAIERLIGVVRRPDPAETSTTAPAAPGMLAQHYAPRSPVRLVTDWAGLPADLSSAAMGFTQVPAAGRFGQVRVLSPTGDLRVAAAGFFAALRGLDQFRPSVIWAELFPPHDLGLALNDRLVRAAATFASATFDLTQTGPPG